MLSDFYCHFFYGRYAYASLVGMDPSNMDNSMAVIYMNHLPDATNTMRMTHMAQVFRNGDRFCK